MSRSPVGAPRRRTRAPGTAVATSYASDAPQINSDDRLWSCAVEPDEWPDWTDAVAFTTELPRRKGGARC